eukprot:TRINITY_DN2593_c1_g1_i1.p1 TRINITY_DN2593_c1_g1~~TRINITY_DN2593_c1_g1_i1.p1  ORF type:complete len:414 (+),score=87.22 TRINITY_DN2593_c1_g1_i1:73-1242(+)
MTTDPYLVLNNKHLADFSYSGYPPVDSTKLDNVPRLLDAVKSEFCISPTFNPSFIDQVCYRGYFPMAILYTKGLFAMAVKLHHNRCILRLDRDELHVERKARKVASKYVITIDAAFDECMALIVAKHGDNWLCPMLRKAFREIHLKNNTNVYRTKLHSCEVWCGDVIMGCELGYVVGTCYTSLTGVYQMDGVGHVQLCALGRLLEQRGVEVWDFGMQMEYKKSLGSQSVPRRQWLELVSQIRQKPVPDLTLTREQNKTCRQIIDWKITTIPTTNTNTNTNTNTSISATATATATVIATATTASTTSTTTTTDATSTPSTNNNNINNNNNNTTVLSKNQQKRLKKQQMIQEKKESKKQQPKHNASTTTSTDATSTDATATGTATATETEI